ncbi:hypothetical protein DFH07DRAFT_956820 [Mycena maculata]|uniref:Uncharacterized protein n=1 Tax=Mycena maculata TaxID=230809 RepID=A0AAD7JGX2_9AGAR|nr:hypothetical protein DFH07DRAFT_956820 [Mycena maculata]
MPHKHAVILLQPSREDETVLHYLLHCPTHANAREELHRLGDRDSCIEKLLTRPKLIPYFLRFIARSGRYHTVFGEIPDLLPLETPSRPKSNPVLSLHARSDDHAEGMAPPSALGEAINMEQPAQRKRGCAAEGTDGVPAAKKLRKGGAWLAVTFGDDAQSKPVHKTRKKKDAVDAGA